MVGVVIIVVCFVLLYVFDEWSLIGEEVVEYVFLLICIDFVAEVIEFFSVMLFGFLEFSVFFSVDLKNFMILTVLELFFFWKSNNILIIRDT